MKAITIKQPWAWAVIHAGKDVENRSWRTHYRGRIAIHAGASPSDIRDGYDFLKSIGKPLPNELAFGAIIGYAEIVDCVPIEDCPLSPWAFGPWCWLLKNPEPCKPIICKGFTKIWECDDV